MVDVLNINNVSVKRGETAEINFHIAMLPTHTMIELPVYVFRGLKPGPCLLLTATIHGDEVNGVETIRQMIQSKSIIPQKGSVIAIPIVNIYGFLQQSRVLPDGKDLNRSFPGTQNGSLANRIAYTIVHEILPHIQYGIDLHTGGASLDNYPQIRSDMQVEENRILAHAFSPPFILNAKTREKSFRDEATKLGKYILVYEGGESMRFSKLAIREGTRGILRVMHHLGMISDAPPPNKTIVLSQSHWVRANYGGLFHSVAKVGEKVKRKQVIAMLTDPFGDFYYQIKSNTNGYIIGINNKPIVHKGDAVIHLGQSET